MRLYEFINPIPCFFHGSNNPDIAVMKPQYSKLVDKNVVFAATLPEIAILMSGHWTDEEFEFGHDTSGTDQDVEFIPYTFRELKPNSLAKYFENKKVYLYQLPATGFDTHDNLQDFEVINTKPVAIHSVVKVDNALDYLRNSPYINVINFDS